MINPAVQRKINYCNYFIPKQFHLHCDAHKCLIPSRTFVFIIDHYLQGFVCTVLHLHCSKTPQHYIIDCTSSQYSPQLVLLLTVNVHCMLFTVYAPSSCKFSLLSTACAPSNSGCSLLSTDNSLSNWKCSLHSTSHFMVKESVHSWIYTTNQQ